MKKIDKNDEVSMKEYLDASMELEELQKKNGIHEEEKGLTKLISKFFDAKENRVKHKVKKSVYIWLTVFLGWCGIHRFYAKRNGLGLLYLALSWTGFPLAMAVIDILEVAPMQKDEEGMVEL